jgi:hypothetical protein
LVSGATKLRCSTRVKKSASSSKSLNIVLQV